MLFTNASFAAELTGETPATANFAGGDLSIEQTMNTIDFGTISLSDQSIVSSAQNGEYSTVVSDMRALPNGYRLTVAAAPLTATDASGDALNGSNISFTGGTVSFDGVDQGLATAPSVIATQLIVDAQSADPTPAPVPVLVAEAIPDSKQGWFSWKYSWDYSNVELTIQPGEALAKSYATTLNWTLSDVPSP